MKLKLQFLFLISFSLLSAQDNDGLLKIGDEYTVNISSNSDYNTNQSGLVFQEEFRSTGSGYVKVHFNNFDLKSGDYVKVYSPKTSDEFFYYDQGKIVGNENEMIDTFWTTTIWSDHIVIELYSQNGNNTHYGFDIDTVAYGYSVGKISNAFDSLAPQDTETVCSFDDKEAIVCYDGTEMGRKSEAVCRLLIGGSGLCTGWLLGCDGNVMTNNHCIGNSIDALNTEFLFNYKYSDCAETTFASSDLVATSSTFIQTDSNLDFTLVMLPVNPTPTYGYLSLSSTIAALGERIYIPQHPGGRRKEIAVNTDVGGDVNGFAMITNEGAFPNRVEYQCDTEGGSSGSPVIRYSDHLVVAIHNTGGCPNGSYGRSDNLIAAIGANMPNCGIDDPNPQAPYITFSSSTSFVNEATGCDYQDIDFNLRIALPPSNNADVTVNVASETATNFEDFEIITPNPITFLAGDNTDKTFTVRIYNDAFIEGDETFSLNLSLNANGGDAQLGTTDTKTITIIDDDFNPAIGNNVTLASDDFESGLTNWIVTGNGTPSFSIGNSTTSSSSSWNTDGNTTNFVYINDDACNCTMDQERVMYTVPFDFSALSTVNLNFDIIYTDSNDQYASDSFVQASTDNGLTWQNVGSELISYSEWTNVDLDLSAYAGQSNVLISFLYNDLGNWAYGLAIDNFNISGQGNADIQTAINDNTTNSIVPLADTGIIYAYDSGNGNIIANLENIDGFDYDCLNVSVYREGTSGQPINGSAAPLLAMDKQFKIDATQTTQSGNNTITFYFTEAEVAGWESAVAGSFTRDDLFINRESNSGTIENVIIAIGSYNGGVTMTGNFTGVDGVFSFAPAAALSNDEFEIKNFKVYPNPATNTLNINSKSDIEKLTIYDINGRLINNISIKNNTINYQIDINNLSQGMYFLEIESNGRKSVEKFIKK
ncbi:MAG: trypsin-like peptidase domain-containing protein [Flavobacteriaceae bacterium]|nr:trypsin-like peptidase domain-containing protein [Flavobacteriaceae bacterium]